MESREHHIADLNRLHDLERLFKSLYPGLIHFANKYLKDEENSKDIVQNAFVFLWENIDTIKEEKAVKSYLYKIVYTRSLNYLRDNKKLVGYDNPEELDRVMEYASSDESTEKEQRLLKIKKAVDDLPDRCREVFVLNKYEGLKYKEIAERLDISIKTVEAQMGKALKVLREELKGMHALMLLLLIMENFHKNL